MKFNETLDHLLRALRMNEEDTDLHPAGAGSAGVMRSPGSVPRSPLPANPLPPWVVRDLSDGSDSVGESSDQTSDEADAAEAAEAAEAEESDEVDDTTEIVRRVLAASPPPLPAHLEPEEPAGDVRQSGNGSLTEQSSVGAATETGSLEHRGVPAPESQSAPLTADEEPVAQPTTVSRWTDSAEDSWRFPVVEPSETAEPEAVEDHEDIAVTGALDHAEPPVLQPSERDAPDATVEPARAEVVLPSPSAADDREAASAEPFVPGEPVSAAGQADLADEFETAPSEDAPDGLSSGPESDPESTTSLEESSELGVSTVAHEAASSDAEVMETSAASPVPRQPDFASLEKAAILAESLNLGFHLGSAVERIAIAAAEGSAGVSALREASWLIDRYIALLEGRPIGADLHRSAVLLTQTGETIAGMRALVDALDLEAHRTQPSEPPAVPTVPTGAQ